MNKDKAMQQALVALETEQDIYRENDEDGAPDYILDAIAAAKEALAQPPLPVQELRRGDILRCIETDELCTVWSISTTGKTLIKWSANNFGNYTAEQIGELFWIEPREAEPAPQRPWVGLTEFQFAEIYNKWNDSNGSTPWGLYHAIEKALKAKNHG